MKIDIKTMMSILAAAAIIGGFYYTTQHRLDIVEREIEDLKAAVVKVRKVANRKNKQ